MGSVVTFLLELRDAILAGLLDAIDNGWPEDEYDEYDEDAA